MTLSPTVAQWKARQPNGQIPQSELQEIPGTHDVDLGGPCRFMPEAARSFIAMREAMGEDIGVVLRPSRSYRTLADQQAKWDSYVARGFAPPVVARPGTSNHGEALAGDMGFGTFSDPRFAWLQDHGHEYGWHQNDAPSEPWHWDYEGDYAPRFNFKEDDMGMTVEEKAAFKDLKERVTATERVNETQREVIGNLRDRVKELEDGGDAGPHSHTGQVTVS